jgi:hypothetical protein
MTDALRHRYEYTVRYRRENWKGMKGRFFHRKSKALEFRRKLLAGDPSLAPIVELIIERRELGPIEIVFDINELP